MSLFSRVVNETWDEKLHPRGESGKFSSAVDEKAPFIGKKLRDVEDLNLIDMISLVDKGVSFSDPGKPGRFAYLTKTLKRDKVADSRSNMSTADYPWRVSDFRDEKPWRHQLHKSIRDAVEALKKTRTDWTIDAIEDAASSRQTSLFDRVVESECDGRTANKPWLTPSGPKKRAVCAKDGDATKLVRFGDKSLEIKRDDPGRRKNFRARHNCDNPGPKTKARYWSCKYWERGKTTSQLDRGESVGSSGQVLSEARASCLDCVRKHLGQAEILMSEALQGYPRHRWLAVGHLGEAADEAVQVYPELAAMIREHRLKYMADPNYSVPTDDLLKAADALANA